MFFLKNISLKTRGCVDWYCTKLVSPQLTIPDATEELQNLLFRKMDKKFEPNSQCYLISP